MENRYTHADARGRIFIACIWRRTNIDDQPILFSRIPHQDLYENMCHI